MSTWTPYPLEWFPGHAEPGSYAEHEHNDNVHTYQTTRTDCGGWEAGHIVDYGHYRVLGIFATERYAKQHCERHLGALLANDRA